MDEPFGSAEGSFEDCDHKFKVEIVETGEETVIGSSTCLRRNKRRINMMTPRRK